MAATSGGASYSNESQRRIVNYVAADIAEPAALVTEMKARSVIYYVCVHCTALLRYCLDQARREFNKFGQNALA